MMRFSAGKCVSILASAAVLLICSCEEHRIGEMPEVQKERVDPFTAAEENSTRAHESKSPTPPAKPTPAEFFPTKHR